MKFADILEREEDGIYEIVEPKCKESAPAYKEWLGSSIVVHTFGKNRIISIMWKDSPNKDNEGFVDMCGMVINSDWEKVEEE